MHVGGGNVHFRGATSGHPVLSIMLFQSFVFRSISKLTAQLKEIKTKIADLVTECLASVQMIILGMTSSCMKVDVLRAIRVSDPTIF